MARYQGKDPYVDPATGTMKNRLGVWDQNELDRIEAAFAAVRSIENARTPIAGQFDLDHMKAIHARLFGDVYEWAGHVRHVDIAKGDTRFAHFAAIERVARDLTQQLAGEGYLRGLDANEFAYRAGYYMGELNVLHPFREGNGRTLREFVGQLANQAGYEIRWDCIEQDEIIRASIHAYHGDASHLAELIRGNLHDCDRDKAFEIARRVAGDKVQFEWAEPGKRYAGRVLGETERYVVQEREGQPGRVIVHRRRSRSSDAEQYQRQHPADAI